MNTLWHWIRQRLARRAAAAELEQALQSATAKAAVRQLAEHEVAAHVARELMARVPTANPGRAARGTRRNGKRGTSPR